MPSARLIRLREHGPAVTVELTSAVAAALQASRLVDVAPTAVPGQWTLRSEGRVGAVSVCDLQVLVEPKVRLNRLVHLMSYARSPELHHESDVDLDDDADFLVALAQSLVWATSSATAQGLLKGYRRTDATSMVLRGRLREADQIRQHYGRMLPVEITYDDHTVNIPENQTLAAATRVLLRCPLLSPAIHRDLRRLEAVFFDVKLPPAGTPLEPWQPTRLNVGYCNALRLADLVLAGDSFEHRVGELRVAGFVLDMWSVFEDFVTTALRRALRAHGVMLDAQACMTLDEDGMIAIRPDLVGRASSGTVFVADVKYKSQTRSGIHQQDLYQVLAYATVTGLDRGHLIYAEGPPSQQIRVRGSRTVLHAHSLSLDRPPEELLADIDLLANLLVSPTMGGDCM